MVSILVTAIFIFFILRILFRFKQEKDYTNEPILGNIASTIGVLGTFIGITMGLLKFDPNNITQSVPQLLDGMKIAFLTSIAGMLASIIMKGIAYKNTKDDEEIDDIIELFNTMIQESRNVNATLIQNQRQTQELFQQINEVWNNNQLELKNEIINLNNNTLSKNEELICEFKKFGAEMTKNSTDVLIEAINCVIKDFNNKINEQLGENFKELNLSVSALLDWQKNYKDVIEMTNNQLNSTFESLHNIDVSLERMAQNSTLINENNENLSNILNDIDNSQNEVKKGIDILIQVADKAKESIPIMDKYFENANIHIINLVDNLQSSVDKNLDIIDSHMEKLTIDVSQSLAMSIEETRKTLIENNKNFKLDVKDYLENFEVVIGQLKNCIPEVNEHLLNTKERFNSTLNAFTSETQNTLQINQEYLNSQVDTLKRVTNDINKNLDNTITDSTKRLEDITVKTSTQISSMVENMEKVFEKKVDQLDELLGEELSKSLNSLGNQLVAISERFAEDYTPLADRLRDIVMMAEEVI